MIDQELNMSPGHVPKSYKHFMEVTKEKYRETWPQDLVFQISSRTVAVTWEHKDEILSQRNENIKKKLQDIVVREMGLKDLPYSFKKIQDRIRYLITITINKILRTSATDIQIDVMEMLKLL